MPDIPIPLVGPSNEGFHIKADSQRTINLIPYKIEREGEKVRWHLVNTPGLLALTVLPTSPIRGGLVYHDGRLFVVAGAFIYEIYSDASYFTWGSIASVDGRVSMA